MCFHVRYYALLVMPLAPFYVISIVILRCLTPFLRYLPKLIMGAFLGMFFVRFKVSWVAHFRGGVKLPWGRPQNSFLVLIPSKGKPSFLGGI